MCLYPKLILNPKYKKNKKNGGIIPPLPDERVKWVPIGCQKCMECRRKKAREWQVRLMEEIKENKNGKFITLTFSNENYEKIATEVCQKHIESLREIPTGYELDNQIATLATRRFLENWRKQNKKSVKHWLVTELGHQGTENIHIHGIIWCDSVEEIEKHWKQGFVWKGAPKWNHKQRKYYYKNYVNEATTNYITKYMTKMDFDHKYYNPVVLCSPGIGAHYTKSPGQDWKRNKFNGNNTREFYKTRTGHKVALPIYLRNKIYSEEERETLWLQKLDKQERWILGKKIDISKDEKEYWGALKWAQQMNKKLGYGDDENNWEQRKYEEQRRAVLMQERFNKTYA